MPIGGNFISPLPGARRIVVLSHFGFILIGIVNTMLGPILPYLTARWHLDDSQAGVVLLAQPLGAILGSLLSGLLIKRFGFARPLIFGFGLMAASLLCLRFESWWIGIASICGTGLALGLTIPTINLLVSEANPERRAAALNLLNLVWGSGAAIGPLLISALTRASGFSSALLFLAISSVAMALLISRSTDFSSPVTQHASTSASPPQRSGLNAYLLLIGALVFVNVGTEAAAGGWLATYVQRLSNSSSQSWALAPSFFWAGMLTARATAPFFLQRFAETKIIMAGMFTAVCGLLIILLSTEMAIVFVGIGLAGFGLGPIFPTTLALFTQRFGAASSHLTGVLFLLAGLGSAFFPFVVGLLSSHFDALRAGLLVPLIGSVVMIVLQIAIISIKISNPNQPRARAQHIA